MTTKKRSAKQLTFIYFSIVACSIILIHATVFNSTMDGLEELVANNRLDYVKENAVKMLENSGQNSINYSDDIDLYYYSQALNARIKLPSDVPLHQTFEVYENSSLLLKTEAFIQRTIDSQGRDVYMIIVDSSFELSENQMVQKQTTVILFSFTLLMISFFAILKISSILTAPLSKLTKELNERSSHDMSLINSDTHSNTLEMDLLINTINNHYERIEQLLARERDFTRYASHELRSPLMVIKGATNLLGQSDDIDFNHRQKQRIRKSTEEMSDFVETLLSLTRSESEETKIARDICQQELINIAASHAHLIADRPIHWTVEVDQDTCSYIPEKVLSILLGNIIKNAFACTEAGDVFITADNRGFTVSDSGIGLENQTRGVEGYGLGLVIVRDICHRYQAEFTLKNQTDSSGCIATIRYRH
ncbi:sensor histidine kinase [Aliivibrio kagoshimensis]|uniref:sensor histidine kinase n=1 Tax=Aliivibrio kagoshimensis TaxID=2910230 RepID=UPI003D149E6C